MSHFAEIDKDGVVQRVIVAEQDFINSGVVGDSFNWIQISYNENFRKNYAGPGCTYDKGKDAFIPTKPSTFNSWTLNEDTCKWEAPVPYPDDNSIRVWNEDTEAWDEEEL